MRNTTSAAKQLLAKQSSSPRSEYPTICFSRIEGAKARSHEVYPQDFVDIFGASGQPYRFLRLRPGYPLSPVGGMFLLGRQRAHSLELFYVGAAESLFRETERLWDRARSVGADQLFSRLNISAKAREAELADVLAALRTPAEISGLTTDARFGSPAETEVSPIERTSDSVRRSADLRLDEALMAEGSKLSPAEAFRLAVDVNAAASA